MSTNDHDHEDPFERLAQRQAQDSRNAAEQEEIERHRREAEDAQRERELEEARRAAEAQQTLTQQDEPLKTSKTPRNAYKSIGNLAIPVLGGAVALWWLFAPAPGAKVAQARGKDEVNALQQKSNVNALLDQMTRDAKPKPKTEAAPVAGTTHTTSVAPTPPAISDSERQAAAKAAEEARRREEEVNAAPLEAPGGQVRSVDEKSVASAAETSVSARQGALRSQLQAMAAAQVAGDTSPRGTEMPSRAPGYAAPGYGQASYAAGGMGSGGYGAAPVGYASHGGMPSGGTPQSYDQEFMNNQRAASEEPLQVLRQQSPTATYVIDQGTPIQAVLLTGINSDLPGDITAMVSYDVYDSRGNGAVLIPKGSKFVGKYNSQVIPGQERVLVAVNRLIRPDGTWISLAGANGTDPMGQSGLEADVNNHFWKIFGTSLIIGAASYLLPSSDRTITSTVGGLGGVQNGGTIAGQALNETVKAVMARNKEIAPTLSRKPGTEFYFMVARDMVLQPYPR